MSEKKQEKIQGSENSGVKPQMTTDSQNKYLFNSKNQFLGKSQNTQIRNTQPSLNDLNSFVSKLQQSNISVTPKPTKKD